MRHTDAARRRPYKKQKKRKRKKRKKIGVTGVRGLQGHQKLGGAEKDSLLESGPVETLISDLWPEGSETVRKLIFVV